MPAAFGLLDSAKHRDYVDKKLRMKSYFIKETKDGYLFWYAPHKTRTYARVLSGKLGEVAKKELIQTDLLRSVDPILKKKKEDLLEKGFTEIREEDFLILDVILSSEFPNNWDEETMPDNLRTEACELNDEINEYLFDRGLSYIWSYLEFEYTNFMMRFFTVNKKITNSVIQNIFDGRIKKMRNKIEEVK